jgi:nucleotide-binding universal stress UspA family protein
MKTTVKKGRTPLRTIAVPTDFFPGSTSAMAYALALAGTGKGRVVAVYAVDPFEYSFGPRDLRDLKKQEVWARAQEAMAQWLQTNKFSGCTTKLVEGEPGPAIATFIGQRGIDLTVLGTSARSHAARLLLGSVAEEIFRKANCLVRARTEAAIASSPAVKARVFATALEPHSLLSSLVFLDCRAF